jgi:uncharacterized membrane protein YhiD involved in acid resistance
MIEYKFSNFMAAIGVSISFGAWQHNLYAGIFILGLFLLFAEPKSA